MIPKRVNSIATKTIAVLALLLSLILLILTMINISEQSQILVETQKQAAQRFSETILTAMRYPMLTGDQEIIQLQFNEYKKLEGVEVINLTDQDGIIRRSTDLELIGKTSKSRFIDSNVRVTDFEKRQRSGKHVFSDIVPIYNEPKCYNCHPQEIKVLGKLRIAINWEGVRKSLAFIRKENLLISILSLFVLMFLSGLLLYKIVILPIRDLSSGMRKVAAGNFEQQLQVRSVDEIGELTQIFNKMTGEIKTLLDKEKKLREQEQEQSAQLARSFSLVNTTLESTADGIMAADNSGKIAHFNRRFLELWQIRRDQADKFMSDEFWAKALAEVEEQRAFLGSLKNLKNDQTMVFTDVLNFKDGRIYEVFSMPQKMQEEIVGRVWSFRDVTERLRAEKELLKKIDELERFNKFVVGRELRMKQLKQEIEALKTKSGKA